MTNSSLETVLILDCEEEIKSLNEKHSSLDTTILNYNEEFKPKKHHRHYKNKSEHRRRRANQRNKHSGSGRAFVTQEICVQKQNFQCIINLNTTVCDHRDNHQKSCDGKRSTDPKYKHNRIVPQCLRPLCRQSSHQQTRSRHSKEHCIVGTQQSRHIEEVHECKKKSKHGNLRSLQASQEKKPSKEKLILTLDQPKTMSPPKKQIESDYEDISTTSLDSYLGIPTSYKHIVNHTEEYQESKLDTLIKRTKERERRLVEQSRKVQWYTSTPAYTEVSSVEWPISCSEVDVSLHSRSTLILEPRENHGYSPTVEGLRQSPMIEKYLQYSPCSQVDGLLTNLSGKSDIELKIKQEPTMDIGVYSPTGTQSTDLQELLKEQWIKKEVKTETTKVWKQKA